MTLLPGVNPAKDRNKILDAIKFSLMGGAGAVTGQNYIGNYMASQKAQQEDPTNMLIKFLAKKEGIDISTPTVEDVTGATSTPSVNTSGGFNLPNTQYSPLEGSMYGKFLGQSPESKIEQALAKQVKSEDIKSSAKRLAQSIGQTQQTVSTQAGLSLGAKSYALAGARGKEVLDSIGINLDPSRGIQGKVFSALNTAASKLGYNPLYKAFEEGMVVELAPELAKTLGGPGSGIRIGRMIIENMKKTIPSLKNMTIEEGLYQLAQTAANTYRKEVSKAVDENGNLLFADPKGSKELDSLINDFHDQKIDEFATLFKSMGIYTPRMKKVRDRNGKPFKIPDYLERKFKKEMR